MLRAALIFVLAVTSAAQTVEAPTLPKAGPVEILPLSEVEAGMKATAWTVFSGSEPEPVPVEILGVMKNTWGPGQDIIMAKLGGKAQRTNVAGGMSGSPVYYDGKLLGAISLRFSVFSPDSVAGITPIELMLEINELDESRPLQAKVPADLHSGFDLGSGDTSTASASADLAAQIWNDRDAPLESGSSYITPIETPLTFSGVHQGVLDVFQGFFRKAGVVAIQGGAVGGSSRPSGGASNALQPGQPIAAVLISGDISASGLGTVSYNDGKRVLAFGHAMFRMGPVEMPMASADVITVLASQFAPVKVANSAEIVGMLRQDRHSGIMGVLGEEAPTIPVAVTVRRFADDNSLAGEKQIHCNVFQNHRWTPPLIVFTLFNSMFGMNEFADESTFRLNGEIDFEGEHRVSLETMQTSSQAPIPAPLLLAGWVGNKVQRAFTSSGETPRIKRVNVSIDLLPKRRLAVVENAWVDRTQVRAGDVLKGKVFLRPYRGDRIERPFEVRIPIGATEGRLRLLISDARTLDRGTLMAGARNGLMSLSETVSLMNKEHGNHQLFITLLGPQASGRLDDKTLPNIPSSVLNVIQGAAKRRLMVERESPLEQTAMSFDSIVSGSYSINLEVK